MQRLDITEIKIPRSCLQNPHNESPLQCLFNTETSLNHIAEIIKTITEAKLTSYIVVVDDTLPLNHQEVIMLQAVQHYIAEHFKNLARNEHSPQSASSSSAAAAAAAAAATTATATAAAADETASAAEAAATTIAAVVAAAATATSAAVAASASTTAADTSPTDHHGTTNDISTSDCAPDLATSDSVDRSPLTSPLLSNAPSIEDQILTHVRTIISLDIWARKGRGIFSNSDPDGISEMKKLENPTLDDIFKIALEKHCQSGLSTSTRANMTGRFYEMLFSLKQSTDLGTRENLLMEFAKKELIRNFNSSKNRSLWSFGKVVLSDADINTLCVIANIEPEDIETLVNSTATVVTAAAAAAAASSSSDASASAATDADADEAPQTGLRR